MNYSLARRNVGRYFLIFTLAALAGLFATACGIKTPTKVPVVLKVEDARKDELFAQINKLTKVQSVRGKVSFKFEDNSFAESGISEKYTAANGQITVQTPENINLKIQIPVTGQDLVSMTSNGEKFRVAIPCCVDEKYRKFVFGSNEQDYSRVQQKIQQMTARGDTVGKQISVFASLRPQHFTDALLMKPIQTGENFTYTQSEIYEDEQGSNLKKPTARQIRGYYLLDELKRNADNSFSVERRFWFDRVGSVHLARQQTFAENGILLATIDYGADVNFKSEDGTTITVPGEVTLTRPQERYAVKVTFQDPASVVVGKKYEPQFFELENKWQLPEVDLDKQAAAQTQTKQ